MRLFLPSSCVYQADIYLSALCSASFRTLFVLLVVDVSDLYSGYRLLRPPNFKVSVKPTGFGSSSAKETHKGALTPSGTPRKQPPGSGFKAPLPPGSPPKSAKVRYCRRC
jgi:hypothetical protein